MRNNRHNTQINLVTFFSIPWLLILFLLPIRAHAFSVSELHATLSTPAVLRGNFVQTRTMSMLSSPLRSTGHFVMSKQQGLIWQQTQPFAVTMVLTQDVLKQRIPGQAEQLIHAADNPMLFYFSTLFLSLFQAQEAVLASHFTLDLTGKKTAWTLTLTPKSAPLNKLFSQITLRGAHTISSLSLHEVRGDITRISFSDITDKPATLLKEENSEFAH